MGAIFAGVESRAINRTILFRNLDGFTPNSQRKILKFIKSVTLALNYALVVCLHVDPAFRHCTLNSRNSTMILMIRLNIQNAGIRNSY